jgi:hypothetical protein
MLLFSRLASKWQVLMKKKISFLNFHNLLVVFYSSASISGTIEIRILHVVAASYSLGGFGFNSGNLCGRSFYPNYILHGDNINFCDPTTPK